MAPGLGQPSGRRPRRQPGCMQSGQVSMTPSSWLSSLGWTWTGLPWRWMATSLPLNRCGKTSPLQSAGTEGVRRCPWAGGLLTSRCRKISMPLGLPG
eukprot:9676566-Lingulodinium_polyedra.AAC.1